MSSLSEISVVHAPLVETEGYAESTAAAAPPGTWSPVEVPRARRPAPGTLVVLAVVAGVGALVLGVLAGVSTTLSGSDDPPKAAPPAGVAGPTEQQALALLAKPSTERVVFRGSGGALVLAVGSGGRAAILVRGLDHAAPGQPYYAWIVGSGRAKRAARFEGTERAVFLTVPLEPRESVVVARTRPAAISLTTQLVALRG